MSLYTCKSLNQVHENVSVLVIIAVMETNCYFFFYNDLYYCICHFVDMEDKSKYKMQPQVTDSNVHAV